MSLYWALKKDTLIQGHAASKIRKSLQGEKVQTNTNTFNFLKQSGRIFNQIS